MLKEIQDQEISASGLRFAIVAARWNAEIVEPLVAGAEACLMEKGAIRENIELFRCPGSYEIPLVVQRCAQSKRYDAVIALGCVIRGDTYHFELVADGVSEGLMKVMLETGCPCIFGVLTTENMAQAEARSLVPENNKGREAALAAIEMVRLLATIPSSN